MTAHDWRGPAVLLLLLTSAVTAPPPAGGVIRQIARAARDPLASVMLDAIYKVRLCVPAEIPRAKRISMVRRVGSLRRKGRAPLVAFLIVVAGGAGAYGGLRAGSPTPPTAEEIGWVSLAAGATVVLTLLQMGLAGPRRGGDASPAEATVAPAPATGRWLSQLPPATPDFVDRRSEMRMIARMVSGRRRSEPAPQVVVISGRGGVGKTTLAIYAAHALARRFRDGQVYANLGGVAPAAPQPHELIDALLRAMGVDGSALPKSFTDRVDLYRSRTVGRRILFVFDNAVDESQLRPLLPSGGGCAVLITSRRRLVGLEGARHIDLDVLDKAAALELFSMIVGRDRVQEEQQAVEEVLGMLGTLPLAVRLAGARLAAKPHWKLSHLRTRLTDERRLLRELSSGDQGILACFRTSYEALSPEEAAVFRLMSVSDAKDLRLRSVAALIGRPLVDAEEVVETLCDARLVEVVDDPYGPRYGFHDLVRAFARDLCQQHDTHDDVVEALDRMAVAYLDELAVADEWLLTRSPRHRLTSVAGLWRTVGSPAPVSGTRQDPIGWFERERPALLMTIRQVNEAGLDERCWQLAVASTSFYEHVSCWSDWLRAQHLAMSSAERAGNSLQIAVSQWCLGRVHHYLGSWDEALVCFRAAYDEFSRTDQRRLAATVLCNIGKVYQLGRFDDAAEYLARAVEEYAALGERHGEAFAKANLADVYHLRGESDRAIATFAECMPVLVEEGDSWWWSNAAIWLGDTYTQKGDIAAATSYLREAHQAFVELGDSRRAAVARVHLGDVWLRLDKPLRALHAYSSALEVFVAAGDRWWQARANQGAGEAYAGLRIYRPALSHLNAALPVYTDLANERLSRRVEMLIDQVKNRQRGNFVMASAPLYNLLARIAKSLARRVPVM